VARGILLEHLTWIEAESVLKADTIVVIPLGAATKEHGPHLKLNNDFQIAEFLKEHVLEHEDVVMAPTVSYCYYPAFVEYPGSVSLDLDTAADTIFQICSSFARFGPQRFYVINTGVSTLKPLLIAAQRLKELKVLLHYTNLEEKIAPAANQVKEQEGGSHADEIETSLMLVIAPESVNMEKAVKDFDQIGKGPLTRTRSAVGTYSPTGIWGDASLATPQKGQAVVKSLVSGVLEDIRLLRQMPLPTAQNEQNLG